MQVSVENTSGLERRLTVQVPGDEIQGKIETKLRELCKQVRIKGFRPGRVPMSVVKQRYGKQVRQDILNETMQQSLQQAINDEDLRPAGMPVLESPPENKAGEDFEFSALLEVFPEIGPLDAAALEIERPKTIISDEDVDEMIDTLRDQRKSWTEVEREVKEGDRVLVEYSAETDDGRVPEEGTQRLAIIMGESEFKDLEKAVASIAAGKSKKLKLEFPENFREPDLAGKKLKTELKVISVSEGALPEVDEEFIQSFGVEDGTMDPFKEEVRKNLERELKQATNNMLKAQLIRGLVKACPDMEVPAGVVREEATGMAAQMLRQQGHELPDEQVRALADPFMEQAEERVRAGLLLGELAAQNEIRVDASKVRAAIESVASTYEQPAEVMQLYYGNQNLLQQVESSVLEEQVVDWVLENAKVTTKAMKLQEVIAAATSQS
ncbi:MAG: trigger factor [Xanthomonadales bacterium]|nr:trigger factor [Gammaproteobacteria bacterium]NND57773.1 trigger factor [Xanthomonadales bacterium]NNK51488.1 trigger factor [Xanthomonadales bacterium]